MALLKVICWAIIFITRIHFITFIWLESWFLDLLKYALKPSLPFKDISLLLGNHFAGEKVVTDPILIDKPCLRKHHISILSSRTRHMDVRGGGWHL